MILCSFGSELTGCSQEINRLKSSEEYFSKRTRSPDLSQPARREHEHSANQTILSGRECEHLFWLTTSHYLYMTHLRCCSASKGLLSADVKTRQQGDDRGKLSFCNCWEMNFTVRKEVWWLGTAFIHFSWVYQVFYSKYCMLHLVYMLHENSSEHFIGRCSWCRHGPASLCPSNHILITLTRAGEDNCPEIS